MAANLLTQDQGPDSGQSPDPAGGNALAPSGGTQNPLEMMDKAHQMAKAMFDFTGKQLSQNTVVVDGLKGLVQKSDTVTREDVIETAGKILGKSGMTANQLATVLADMPQDGQGLAQWLQGHLAQRQQFGERFMMMHSLSRHEMGTSAMRLLMAHHAVGNMPPGASGDSTGNPATNPLMSSAPGLATVQ